MSVFAVARNPAKVFAGAAVVDDAILPGEHQQRRQMKERRGLAGVSRELAVFAGESPRDRAERQRVVGDERLPATGRR